jgi:hypothetical protein
MYERWFPIAVAAAVGRVEVPGVPPQLATANAADKAKAIRRGRSVARIEDARYDWGLGVGQWVVRIPVKGHRLCP